MSRHIGIDLHKKPFENQSDRECPYQDREIDATALTHQWRTDLQPAAYIPPHLIEIRELKVLTHRSPRQVSTKTVPALTP
ncbi:MAG TPA: hypothetical protein VNK46_16930 [Nitrospiraceae bacterium]|nr:hypothetical protein [Nitrospiraceae bacterium]